MAGSPAPSRLAPLSLGFIFLTALGIRLLAAALFVGLGAPLDGASNPDQIEYEAIAHNVLTGHGYGIAPDVPTAARPPGTPFAILVPYLVAGRSALAARLWFATLSALTCAIVAMVAARAGGKAVGLVAGLWLAVYPGQLAYSVHLLGEPVFGVLLAATLLFALAASESANRTLAWLAALCLGATMLTRVEFLLVLGPAAALAWWQRAFLGAARLRVAAIMAAGAIVVLSPWPIRNAVVMGKPVLSTQRGFVWWGAHNDLTFTDPALAGGWVSLPKLVDAGHPLAGSEIARDAQAYAYGSAAIRRHWTSMPYLILMKEWRLLSPISQSESRLIRLAMTLGWGLTLPFVAIGAFTAWRADAGSRWRWALVSLPLWSTVLSAAIFYGLPRFRDGVAPAFVPFAALGFCRLLGRWLPRLGGNQNSV